MERLATIVHDGDYDQIFMIDRVNEAVGKSSDPAVPSIFG
jgi:hypothetical protein